MRKCSPFRADERNFALLVAISRKWIVFSRNEQQKVYLLWSAFREQDGKIDGFLI